MSGLELIVGVVVLVGLVGIVVPVLPGTLLILAALAVWALDVGTGTAWSCFAGAAALIALGQVVKYTIPGRRLREAGVPASSLAVGGLLGIAGFFVVPVAGLFLGFVLGVWAAEHRRVGARAAWPSTRVALGAVGLSLLIELASGLLATAVWILGVIAT